MLHHHHHLHTGTLGRWKHPMVITPSRPDGPPRIATSIPPRDTIQTWKQGKGEREVVHRRNVVELIRRRARDPNIPNVVVEAEANSNKQRPLRFAAYGLFALYGLAVMLGNIGVLEDDMALPLTFFDRSNKILSLVGYPKTCINLSQPASLAIGVVATCLSAYFYSSEIDQREQNIARIWGSKSSW